MPNYINSKVFHRSPTDTEHRNNIDFHIKRSLKLYVEYVDFYFFTFSTPPTTATTSTTTKKIEFEFGFEFKASGRKNPSEAQKNKKLKTSSIG